MEAKYPLFEAIIMYAFSFNLYIFLIYKPIFRKKYLLDRFNANNLRFQTIKQNW